MTVTAADQPRCKRCGRELSRKQVIATRVGTFCARHADRLAPHLRKPPHDHPRAAAA